MRKLVTVLILAAALLLPAIANAGILPSANTLYGEFMPSPEFATGKQPVSDTYDNTARTLVFEPFTDGDYIAFGKYLGAWGCKSAGSEADADAVTVEVKKGKLLITFTYNHTLHSACVVYPKGTRPETGAGADGSGTDILPSLKTTFGVKMPSLRAALGRKPVSDTTDDKGNQVMVFAGVTEAEFETFGRYAASYGCVLKSRKLTGSEVVCVIEKNGGIMELAFDNAAYKATVTYSASAFTDDTESMPKNLPSESILPSADEIYGISLPSLSIALGRSADEQTVSSKGELTQTFNDFGETDYNTFSAYLMAEGCAVTGYTMEGQRLRITLSLNGTPFVFVYDRELKTARIIYEKGTRPRLSPLS